MRTSGTSPDVVVVGAGIVGAAVAWRAVGAGLTVTLLDPRPGDGATHAAAGMLAPVSESWFGESALARLGMAGLAAWPRFAADLRRATGLDTGLREAGTLVAAYDADDVAQLRRWLALHAELGLEPTELTGTSARRREPLLGHRVAGAAWVPGDHVADPRATHAALDVALHAQPGAAVVRHAALRLERDRGAVVGVHDDAGTLHRAGAVVLAAGWRSAGLADVPVRPVRGQTLRLDAPPGTAPQHVVRGRVQGRPVYVVPRQPGTGSGPGTTPEHREVVIGATSEEGPDDRRPSAGGVFALLRDARALVPALDEAAFVEATLRARPATPDNLPLVGPSATPGLHLATGHHRGGVLLAPLTADAVVAGLTGAALPAALADAAPDRFAPVLEGA
ncbi:glycine oxidase ThiO [Isoptericola sp. S6320L]|uniref:glycine oxidase ThiO n=1 Tax=Isoptericola sp. S6320L TaxID=2926411 RepID=UPI001FF65F23|nr:glycine oxidase ThiO [Isoptericola sp. S6320L]MCK0118096.1 glycine oxidase ThiO [Isoptericola sp. S6320L]